MRRGTPCWLGSIDVLDTGAGAGAFGADWAALLDAIREKAGKPETSSNS
jgi:hypothetical protein